MYVYEYKLYSGLRLNFGKLYYQTQIQSDLPLSDAEVDKVAKDEMGRYPKTHSYKVNLINSPEIELERKIEENREKLRAYFKFMALLESAKLILQEERLLGGHRDWADQYLNDLINAAEEEINLLENK